MAWIVPTVMGLLALAGGPNVLAQTAQEDAGKWTIQASDPQAQSSEQPTEQTAPSSDLATSKESLFEFLAPLTFPFS